MYCKSCGQQIDDGAKFCAHCGAATSPTGAHTESKKHKKKKKPLFKRWWFWAIVIVFVFVSCMGSSEPTAPEQPQISEAEYKALCTEIAYEDLARNPDSYVGDYFTFTGQVIQVMEDDGIVNLRMDVTPVYFGDELSYYEDTIFVITRLGEDGSRILEEDIITIYGICGGLYTYETVLGSEMSIPGIDAGYWEVVG